MGTCNFCDLDQGEFILESKFAACIAPAHPIRLGHFLVIARRHVERFSDLTEAEASDLFVLARRVSGALHCRLHEEKLYVVHIGDVDVHFHVHLLPRLRGEEKLGPFIFGQDGWKTAVSHETDDKEQEALKKYIRSLVDFKPTE
jgi:diadenosine tetraphosphate (Ap4A) HIT family hydrolase